MGLAVAEVHGVGRVEVVVRLVAPLTSAGRHGNSQPVFGLRTCWLLLDYLICFCCAEIPALSKHFASSLLNRCR